MSIIFIYLFYFIISCKYLYQQSIAIFTWWNCSTILSLVSYLSVPHVALSCMSTNYKR